MGQVSPPQNPRVAVVVDSAASLPENLARDAGVYVVPMSLELEGKTFLDGRDLAPAQFYRMLRESRALPKTSAPSPSRFLDAFKAAAELVPSVLCLTVSPRFSSSFEAARTAVGEAEETLPDLEIALLDSESAAGGQGLIALEAARAAESGRSLLEVVAEVRNIIPRVRLVAFLDTLQYLWKGGRVPGIAYMATSVLRIKPVFELSEGEVRSVARPRTTRRATQRLLDLMRERVGEAPVHAMVLHADAPAEAEQLRQTVDDQFYCQELRVGEFSPVMGAHTGPGLLGIAFWSA